MDEADTHEDIEKSQADVDPNYHEIYQQAFVMIDQCQALLKEKGWEMFQKTDESALMTKLSDRKLICIKSKAIIHESIDKIQVCSFFLSLKLPLEHYP